MLYLRYNFDHPLSREMLSLDVRSFPWETSSQRSVVAERKDVEILKLRFGKKNQQFSVVFNIPNE